MLCRSCGLYVFVRSPTEEQACGRELGEPQVDAGIQSEGAFRVPTHGTLTFVSDTSPKANARYFQLLRQAGPERRLAICVGLSRATRELAMAGIKQKYPDRAISGDELRQKLAERLYGAEVARRVFAGHPA